MSGQFDVMDNTGSALSEAEYGAVWAAAEAQGKALYEELLQVHGESVRREQERAEAGIAARRRMIERLGLQSVRSSRLQEVQEEERNWRQDIDRRERVVPEMTPILVARVQGVGG